MPTRSHHPPPALPSLQLQALLWRDVMENRFYGFSSILVIEVRKTEPSKEIRAEVMIRHLISPSAKAWMHFAVNLREKPKYKSDREKAWAESPYSLIYFPESKQIVLLIWDGRSLLLHFIYFFFRKEQLTQWHFFKMEGDDSLKASCALWVRKDGASGFKK